MDIFVWTCCTHRNYRFVLGCGIECRLINCLVTARTDVPYVCTVHTYSHRTRPTVSQASFDKGEPASVCAGGQSFTLTPAMVTIAQETKTVSSKKFVPGVIEPSFGIGRIIYCMLEHCYYTRDGEVRGCCPLSVKRVLLTALSMQC